MLHPFTATHATPALPPSDSRCYLYYSSRSSSPVVGMYIVSCTTHIAHLRLLHGNYLVKAFEVHL